MLFKLASIPSVAAFFIIPEIDAAHRGVRIGNGSGGGKSVPY
jgi:hypothetical protein